MKRREFALLLSAAMALSLVSCGKSTPAASASQPAAEAEEMVAADTSAPDTQESFEDEGPLRQFQCIADNTEQWLSEEEFASCFYAVTDLDGNGRLEVIASCCEGSGLYSTSQFYEVNEKADGLDMLNYGVEEGDSEPDLLLFDWTTYTNGDDTYYLVNDELRVGGAEHFTVRYALSKKGSDIQLMKLGACHMLAVDDEDVEETYYDGESNEISMTDYYNIEELYFSGFEYGSRSLGWRLKEEIGDAAVFAQESYETFAAAARGTFSVRVYTDPTSQEYQELGEDVVELTGMEGADTTVRFTSQQDGVHVVLEYGEWLDGLYWYHPISEVFAVNTVKGTVYEFPAYLPEGIQNYRLRVSQNGYTGICYPTYDGSGEHSSFEMYYEEPQFILPNEDDAIMSLCRAYAGALVRYGDLEAVERKAFWNTVGNAAMLQTLRSADADEEGRVYLPEWLMDSYARAMFPYTEVPELKAGGSVTYDPSRDEPYSVKDAMTFHEGNTQILNIEAVEDDTVQVTVSVRYKKEYHAVTLYLTCDQMVDSENPFGYLITGGFCNVG